MKDQNPFKQKLYSHTMPVREGLWDTIQAKLPPEHKERRLPFFWLFLFSSALLGGGMMLGFLNTQEANTTPSISVVPSQEESHKESTHISPTPTTNENVSITTASSTVSTPNVKSGHLNTSSSKANIHSKQKTTKSTISADALINEHDQSADITGYASGIRNATVSALLPGIDASLSTDERDATMEMFSLSPDPNCYKFSSSTHSYALSADLYAGPGFGPRSFEQTGGEASNYASAREETESYQYAWSAGARLNLALRNGLAFRLGLQYEQNGDIFDYTDTLATQSTTRVDSFFSSDGTFLYADTNRVLIFGTLIKKIHNTYRHLDIPLLVSYELPLGRSMLMVNAGPVINLTSSQEGQILDSGLHPRSITPGDPGAIDVYKTNVGLSVYLGVGALFPLTDHLSALIEPTFLYRLNPVSLDSYMLKEHRHYASLNLGIRYYFD